MMYYLKKLFFSGELDPTVEFWTDASLEHGGGLSSHGGFVQRSWTSSGLADDPSTNLLETRAACESVMALCGPGDPSLGAGPV